MEMIVSHIYDLVLMPTFWQWTGMFVVAVFIAGSMWNLFRIKKCWWSVVLLVVLGFLAGGTVVYIGDLANLPPTFLVILLIIWVCCEDSGWKKLCMGLLFGSTMFAWNAIVDNFIRNHPEYFLLPRVIFAFLFYVITRLAAPEKDENLAPGMWRLILLLTMVPVGNVLSTVLLSDERWEPGRLDLRLHFAVLCLSLVAFVGPLWAIRVLVRQRKLEQEAMYAWMNQKYYESMEQQHFEIRRLRHDMANHLQTLSALPEEERQRYIEELLAGSAVTKTLNYCGDSTVNAVLSVKETFLRQQHISWEIKLDIPEELPFEKADICAIFANGLDNAAEACVKLPEKERKITLQGRAGKGMLALKIINPCEAGRTGKKTAVSGGVRMAKGKQPAENKNTAAAKNSVLPGTTKGDRKKHGYGLRSIEESVLRYGGNMEIYEGEGDFELFCYLPFPLSK